MSRELSDYDWQIFKKLCPEEKGEKRYRSILPPLSKFYATSKEDFVERLERLSVDELEYIIKLIEKGDECLTCLLPEYKDAFIDVVGRKVSAERATKLKKFIDFLSTME